MLHRCIVPQCNNYSVKCPELSFYRFPLHNEEVVSEHTLQLMNILEFVVPILKIVKRKGKMLCLQYMHGQRSLLPDLLQISVLIQWLKLVNFVLQGCQCIYIQNAAVRLSWKAKTIKIFPLESFAIYNTQTSNLKMENLKGNLHTFIQSVFCHHPSNKSASAPDRHMLMT